MEKQYVNSAESTPNQRPNATPSLEHRRWNTRRFPALPGIDMRSAAGRRFRRHYLAIEKGMPRTPTKADVPLLIDAAVLSMRAEDLAAASAGPVEQRPDPDTLVRFSGALSRALERLGLTQPPEPEKPDPQEHAKRIRNPSYWEDK